MQTLECVPAYGRDYKSKAAVMKDWNEGKDFIIQNPSEHGRAINKADAEKTPGLTLMLRYKRLQNVVVVNIPAK